MIVVANQPPSHRVARYCKWSRIVELAIAVSGDKRANAFFNGLHIMGVKYEGADAACMIGGGTPMKNLILVGSPGECGKAQKRLGFTTFKPNFSEALQRYANQAMSLNIEIEARLESKDISNFSMLAGGMLKEGGLAAFTYHARPDRPATEARASMEETALLFMDESERRMRARAPNALLPCGVVDWVGDDNVKRFTCILRATRGTKQGSRRQRVEWISGICDKMFGSLDGMAIDCIRFKTPATEQEIDNTFNRILRETDETSAKLMLGYEVEMAANPKVNLVGETLRVHLGGGKYKDAVVESQAGDGCYVNLSKTDQPRFIRWNDLYREADGKLLSVRGGRPPKYPPAPTVHTAPEPKPDGRSLTHRPFSKITPPQAKGSHIRIVEPPKPEPVESQKAKPAEAPATTLPAMPLQVAPQASPHLPARAGAESFFRWLASWRAWLGMTQAELSEACGVTAHRISIIECKRTLADDDELLSFAAYAEKLGQPAPPGGDWLEIFTSMRALDAIAGIRPYSPRKKAAPKPKVDDEEGGATSAAALNGETLAPSKITVVIDGRSVTGTPEDIRKLMGM
jgi:transcriptional regulator with XRE-family HTH domain